MRKQIVLMPAAAGALSAGGSLAPVVSLRYDRLKLGPGLGALVSPVPAQLPATFALFVRAGSDHELVGEAGASHLARLALLDPSTSPVASAALQEIRDAGGTFEARTCRGLTLVKVEVPGHMLSRAISVLDPFVSPPRIPEDALDRAKVAAHKEADAWWADPAGVASHVLVSLLLGTPSEGLFPDPAQVMAPSAETVDGYVARTFVGEAMVLGAAVSDEDLGVLSSLAAPALGDVAPTPASASGQKWPAVQVLETASSSDADHAPATASVSVGMALPGLGEQGGICGQVLASALASDVPGTVRDALSRSPGVLGSTARVELLPEATLLVFDAEVVPGQEAGTASLMVTSLALGLIEPPRDPVLGHAAGRIASGWVAGLQDPFMAPELLASHELVAGASLPAEDHLAAIMQTGAAAAASLCAGLDGRRMALVVVPSSGLSAGSLSADVRSAVLSGLDGLDQARSSARVSCAPAGGTSSSEAGGVHVLASVTPALGSVAVTGVLGVGSLADPPGREGTTRLLAQLMARELGRGVEASPALDASFVRTSAFYMPDHVGVTLLVPAGREDQALMVVRRALLDPAMDVTTFELARQQCMATGPLFVQPTSQALRAALGALLGQAGPLDPEGDVSSLGILTRDGVAAFHAAALAQGAAIAIGGEVDPETACVAGALAVHAAPRLHAEPALLAQPSPGSSWATATVDLDAGGQEVLVVGALLAPGLGDPGSARAEALSMWLDGPDGPLAEVLVSGRALASQISASYWATGSWGAIVLSAVAPATNADDILLELFVIATGIEKHPPSPEKMEKLEALVATRRASDLALPWTASRVLALSCLF